MSISNAIEFIRFVREDESLRASVAAISDSASLEDLASLGSKAGLAFTAEQLRFAYAHDWELRMMRLKAQYAFKAVNDIPVAPQAPWPS